MEAKDEREREWSFCILISSWDWFALQYEDIGGAVWQWCIKRPFKIELIYI